MAEGVDVTSKPPGVGDEVCWTVGKRKETGRIVGMSRDGKYAYVAPAGGQRAARNLVKALTELTVKKKAEGAPPQR